MFISEGLSFSWCFGVPGHVLGLVSQRHIELSHLQMQQRRRAQQRELANQTATIRATEDRMCHMMARGSLQSMAPKQCACAIARGT
jgi:hypothetical protein